MKKYNIIVTAASGIEGVAKSELKKLGVENARSVNGKINFQGTFEELARCNMFLRCADKVLLQVGKFKADNFDALFDGVFSLPWEDFLDSEGKFLINGKSSKSKLFAISACQSIIKKAIIERLKKRTHKKNFQESGVDFYIDFNIYEDIVILSFNTSGEGLHKRGYRNLVGEAPLKETLAAALILLSEWKTDTPFIDPFCGSGTLPVEAALIARNIAPGLNRSFAMENYSFIDKSIMKNVRKKALETIDYNKTLRTSGFDIDKNAIDLSVFHSQNAGVKDDIHFQTQDISKLSSRFSLGTIVTNPPYGERLMNKDSVIELYKTFGKVCKSLDRWTIAVLTSFMAFERYFGKRAIKNRKLYNAKKECRLFIYK